MKKMKFMRIAAVMLILCLASTCAISGTFAKYTTSVTSQDSARVAKWGFGTMTLDITGLFNTAYTGDNGMSAAADAIAPGTTNSVSFTLVAAQTTPEVAYSITVSTEGSSIDNSIKTNPNIQWKLDTNEWGTWDKMITDIKGLSGDSTDGSKNYAANTAAPAALNTQHTIAWQWVFETADDTATTDKNEMVEQDKVDTTMGDAATLAAVTLKINITATQLDTYTAD